MTTSPGYREQYSTRRASRQLRKAGPLPTAGAAEDHAAAPRRTSSLLSRLGRHATAMHMLAKAIDDADLASAALAVARQAADVAVAQVRAERGP